MRAMSEPATAVRGNAKAMNRAHPKSRARRGNRCMADFGLDWRGCRTRGSTGPIERRAEPAGVGPGPRHSRGNASFPEREAVLEAHAQHPAPISPRDPLLTRG